MDPITAALDTCRFADMETGEAHSCIPWAVEVPGGIWPISLYVFTGTPCYLSMGSLGPMRELRDKSVCLILRGRGHVVHDTLLTKPNQPADLRNPANTDRFQMLEFGGAPDNGVTSTFYIGTAPMRGFNTTLFDALPDALILNFDELPPWLCHALGGIRNEFGSARPGFKSAALRHAELVVINVIRHYVALHGSAMPAWISLPSDSRVAVALRGFHRDISRQWTLQALAEVAATSRSRLIAAAQQEMGEGIFSYINRVRMEEAARLLCNTSLAVGRVASQVGYLSEAAFTVAFRRHTGMQPREYRYETPRKTLANN